MIKQSICLFMSQLCLPSVCIPGKSFRANGHQCSLWDSPQDWQLLLLPLALRTSFLKWVSNFSTPNFPTFFALSPIILAIIFRTGRGLFQCRVRTTALRKWIKIRKWYITQCNFYLFVEWQLWQGSISVQLSLFHFILDTLERTHNAIGCLWSDLKAVNTSN